MKEKLMKRLAELGLTPEQIDGEIACMILHMPNELLIQYEDVYEALFMYLDIYILNMTPSSMESVSNFAKDLGKIVDDINCLNESMKNEG